MHASSIKIAGLWYLGLLQLVSGLEPSSTYQFGPNTGGLTNFPNELNLGKMEFQGYSVIGFGDFNSDKYTDIVLLHSDLKTIQVALFEEKEKGFVLPPAYRYVAKNEVVNVIPADWDYDGQLDLLLLTATSHAKVLDMEIVVVANGELGKGRRDTAADFKTPPRSQRTRHLTSSPWLWI